VTASTETGIVAALVFVAALLQATVFASFDVLGGTPDVLLLVLLGIALLRGSVTGAVAGFGGGLLLDVITLDTLGLTALILALTGYWAGRYGETTGRARLHAPIVTVLVATILVALVGFFLHFLLGEEVSARRALVDALLAGLGLNLIFGAPVLALCRSLLRERAGSQRTVEVKLLG
jgi:rod shape-determining protein MreD